MESTISVNTQGAHLYIMYIMYISTDCMSKNPERVAEIAREFYK